MTNPVEFWKWLVDKAIELFYTFINFILVSFMLIYTTYGLFGVLVIVGLLIGVSAILGKIVIKYVVKAFKFVWAKWQEV
jgi:hypothetical protein